MTRRKLTGAILVATGVSLYMTAASPGAIEKSTIELHGGVRHEPASSLVLTVRMHQGQLAGGRLTARQVTLNCDGELRQVNLPSAQLRFSKGRSFSADSYRDPQHTGIESYVRVRGELERNGRRAEGFIAAYVNPVAGTSGDPPDPECTTAGLAAFVVTK